MSPKKTNNKTVLSAVAFAGSELTVFCRFAVHLTPAQ